MVIDALLAAGETAGYKLVRERLVGREGGGAFVRVLPDGGPAVVLMHPTSGTEVRLVPERSYPAGPGSGLRSITYTQRPDIAIEIRIPGERTTVLLFDPKYKLDGELLEAAVSDGKPKKVDIDKMHAYRDAIRDDAGDRVVVYAAILYPGPAQEFRGGIEALSAHPGVSQTNLRNRLMTLVDSSLKPTAAQVADIPRQGTG